MEAFGANGQLQFSTQIPGAAGGESLEVIDAGSIYAGGTVSYNPANEFLGFSKSTTGRVRGITNSTQTAWTSHASWGTVLYVKLKKTSVTAENSAQAYGLRVFKSNGSTLSFSSGYSHGTEILAVTPSQTVGSTPNLAGAGVPMFGGRIYVGNPSGVYTIPGQMSFVVPGQHGHRLDCLDYQYSGSRIGVSVDNLVSYYISGIHYRFSTQNASSIITLRRKQ